jgi:hypothetical protein
LQRTVDSRPPLSGTFGSRTPGRQEAFRFDLWQFRGSHGVRCLRPEGERVGRWLQQHGAWPLEDRKVIDSAVHDVLKPLGFKKGGATWRAVRPETILVVNVQKSPWGDGQCYVNLGVYLRNLDVEAAPPAHRCHIRTRLEGIVEDRAFLIDAFDLRTHMPPDERKAAVRKLITEEALKWLEDRASEDNARHAILHETKRTGLIFATALRHLGIDHA